MKMSHDRIADPWGARTPYGAGGTWPTQVDTHLADAFAPEQEIDGRMVRVRGRAEDRVNRSRPGPKDLIGWQANHAADRLTCPLAREGDRLVEADWDTAMDRIVARITLLEHGDGNTASAPTTTASAPAGPHPVPATVGGPDAYAHSATEGVQP